MAAMSLLLIVWLVGLVPTPTAQAVNYTWGNPTTNYWTNQVNWVPSTGTPGSGDIAWLTNSFSGSSVTILNSGLGNSINNVVISNSLGRAWLIVTNSSLISGAGTLGSGGGLQIDSGGTFTSTGAFNWRGTNGIIWLNSGGTLVMQSQFNFGDTISGLTGLVATTSGAGPGGTWQLNGQSLWVGLSTATGNVLTISGVTLTNVTAVSAGNSSAVGNTLILTNGAQVFTTGNNYVGGAVSNQIVVVGGGGTATTFWNLGANGSHFYIGTAAGANGNVLRIDGNGVTAGAIVTNVSYIDIGGSSSGAGNSLIVTNGGFLATGNIAAYGSQDYMLVMGGGGSATSVVNMLNTTFYFGFTGGAYSSNVLRIDGAGVAGGAKLTNVNNLSIGAANGNSFNQVIVTNGGQMWVGSGGASIGNSSSSSNNFVYVGGGSAASLWNNGAATLGVGQSDHANNNQMVVDGQGVIGSAVVTNLGALNIGIGTSSFSNLMVVTKGGQVFDNNQLTIGGGSWSTGSVLRIDGGGVAGGALVTNGAYLDIGNSTGGAGNWLIITNGGLLITHSIAFYGSQNSVLVAGGGGAATSVLNLAHSAFYLGFSSGTYSGNVVRIDGAGVVGGAIVTNLSSLTVGAQTGDSFNQLIITNGGQLWVGGAANIGGANGSSNNQVYVGSGSAAARWDNGGNTLYVGSAANANNNQLVVDGTGVAGSAMVTNVSAFSIGSGAAASGNILILTNGGQLFTSGNNVVGGTAGANSNQMIIAGGGPSGASSTWNMGGGEIRLGYYSSSTGNLIRVDGNGVNGGAIITNVGYVNVGTTLSGNSAGVGNGIVITNGGRLFTTQGINFFGTNNYVAISGGTATSVWNVGNNSIAIGSSANNAIQGAGQYLSINGNGLLGGAVVTNVSSVTVGSAVGSVSNQLLISRGGILYAGSVTVGSGAGTTGNVAWVQSGGVLAANTLATVTGTGNAITNSGGIYQFSTAAPTITPGAGAGSIAINSGTIAFNAMNNADVTSSSGNGNLKNISFSGANTFMLNAASNTAASVSQAYNFSVISGNPSNYVNLVLVNGQTAYGHGDLTIGSTGTLVVSNTIATIGGNLTNSGVVTIQNSPVTFASNFVNQGTVQLGSNSTVIGLLTMNNGTLATLGNLPQIYASNLNLQATGTFDTSSGNLTLAGAVTNGGSLIKIGTGVLTLAGTNTYTGGTVVQNGSLILGNALAVSNGTALTVNGGIFDANGSAHVVSTLNGTGGVISNSGLTVTSGGSYAGVIAGTGGLVNTGAGATVLILSGTNTYSGGTTISNGAVQAASSSALGSGAASVLTGGALQLTGGSTLGNALTLAGTGVANDGALRNIGGNNSLTNTVTLGSAVRINTDDGQLTLSNLVNSGGFNLSVGGAGTTIVAQVVGSGSGGLLKDGTGALTLNGTLDYAGPTTVSNGTLAVNGALASVGVVNVFSNATLTGNASLGNVTISGGGTIAAGNNGVGSITAAALTLAANSKLAFEFSAGTFDQILVTNANGLTINGGVLDLYKANTTTTFDLMGSYPLIEYAGTLDGAVTNQLSVANKTGNRLYGFSLNGGWLTLSITSTGGLGWVGTTTNGFWSSPANWAGGQVPVAGDQLIFDGQTGLSNTNDLTAHTQFSGIFFNSTAGAFTLNSNAVDLLSGVVNLSANTQTLNLPLVLAASNLLFNTVNGSVVVNGAISETNGSFGLAKSGAYTLTLAGPNTYTGGTILNGGTLSVGAISDSGVSGISTSGMLTFNGGALQYTGAGAGSTLRSITNIGIASIDVMSSTGQLTLGGVISGGNGLLKSGAGTLVLSGANTYAGGTTISNGTLAISADNNLGAASGPLTFGGGTLESTNNFALNRTRDVTLNSSGGTFRVDTNSTLTMGSTVGGAGALTKSGAGMLVLSNAANNYSGGTIINGGTLALGTDSGSSENSGALGGGSVAVSGGSQLRLGGGATTTNSIGNDIALNAGLIYAVDGVQHLTGALAVNSGGGTLSAQAGTKDLFLDGVVSGSGALTVYDTGTLTGSGHGLVRFANNNNTYSGLLTITNAGNNGAVSVDAPNALQSATVNDLSGYGNSLVFYQANAGATNVILGALGGTANIILQTWNTTSGGDPLVTGGAVTLTVGGNSNSTTYSGAFGGSGALVKTGTGTMTLAGANANSGGVTISNGTLQLSGGNNRLFTNGAVTVAGGTLNLGGFTQTNVNTFTIFGVLTNGTVAKSGADYLGQAGTVSATLAGAAGLTKSTTGTLTLNGTQTYTGATTVSNGTLVVNGALSGAGSVNVLNTATLAGTATLGNLTVGTGGLLTPGNNGIGTMGMGTLTTAAGSLFNFDFTGSANDQLLVTANNGLTVTGGVFSLYQSGTTRTFDALGTYNLISYAGAIGGPGVSAFTVTNTVDNRLYTFSNAVNWVTLTIAGQGISWVGTSQYWSDTNSWANHKVPTNGVAVFDGNTQTAPINDLADHALLAGITFAPTAAPFTLRGLATGTNIVDLEGSVINLSPNTQTINLPLEFVGVIGGGRTFNASNGAITVNGVISETNFAFSLVKEGTNLLVLAGANTYSGGTVLNAGTLGIGTSSLGSTGALGSGTLFIHAGSVVAANGAQTLNNDVSVVGNFSVGGNQDLTLAGSINLSNATRVITINNTANTYIAGAVSNGALTMAGTGRMTVTGTLAYNGVTTINGGTLQLGDGGNSGTLNNNATVQNNSVLAFNRSDDLIFSNQITGTGAVVQNGANVVTLSNGGNTYSGATVINGGGLNVGILSAGGAASAIGAASSAASNLVLNGGALQYTGSGATVDRLFTLGDGGGTVSAAGGPLNLTNTGALGMTGTMSRTLVLTGNSNGLLAASIGDPSSGQTALLKTGTNVWVLSNTNTYSGSTTISGGSLLLAGALAAQNSTVNNLLDGGLTFSNSTNFIVGGLAGAGNLGLTNTAGGAITLSVGNNNSNTTYLGVLSGSGALTKLGTGTLTLTTNQAYLGGTTVSAGTLQLGGLVNTLSTNGAISVAGGVLNLGGATQFTTNTVTISSGGLTNGILTKSGADYAGQGGTVAAVLAGDVGLVKTTSGTLTLSGANTYTGPTLISNGTLQVNGQLITTGLVTVASGATLAGNGGTAGNVTVSSGGILAPGSGGIGSLTLTTLNVTNGSLFNYEFAGLASDQLIVTATDGLNLNGGEFRLYQAGTTAPFDTLGTYNLIRYAGWLQGSGIGALSIDPTTETGNRLYTFGTNGGWVTLTIAGQGTAWVGNNSALWSDPGNWGGGTTVPTNGFAVFTGNSRLDTTNDLANARFSGITFDAGAGSFTLNSALAGANTVTVQGDVVNLSPNTQTINLPLLIAGAQGGTFNTSNANIIVAGNLTFDSSGSGLLKTGPQALELTGHNTYTQTTTIAGGILRVDSGALSPNSKLIFTNGVLESRGIMTLTRSVGTGAGSIQWAGSGGFSAKGGTLTVNLGGAGGTLVWGANSFVPNGGTLQFSSSQADRTVQFMNALNLNGQVRTIQVTDGSAILDVDMIGAISGTTGSGLIKTGAGTMRLSADSTISGPVTVNDGTLLLASTLTSAGVFVNSGATVGGTGTFASPLTLASGSILSPGQGGAGLLTASSLSLSNGFVYDWELGMTATDRVDVTALNGLNYFGSQQWTLQLGTEPGVSALAQWQGSGVLTDQFVLFQFNGLAPASLTNSVAILGGGGGMRARRGSPSSGIRWC